MGTDDEGEETLISKSRKTPLPQATLNLNLYKSLDYGDKLVNHARVLAGQTSRHETAGG